MVLVYPIGDLMAGGAGGPLVTGGAGRSGAMLEDEGAGVYLKPKGAGGAEGVGLQKLEVFGREFV